MRMAPDRPGEQSKQKKPPEQAAFEKTL